MLYDLFFNSIQMLSLVSLESVAGFDCPPIHPPLEPFRSLRRGSVSKRIGTDPASRHALKTVVPYRRGSAERALYVASFQ